MKRQKETTIASNDVTKSMHQVTSPKVAPGDARETPCDGHATSGRHLLNGSLAVHRCGWKTPLGRLENGLRVRQRQVEGGFKIRWMPSCVCLHMCSCFFYSRMCKQIKQKSKKTMQQENQRRERERDGLPNHSLSMASDPTWEGVKEDSGQNRKKNTRAKFTKKENTSQVHFGGGRGGRGVGLSQNRHEGQYVVCSSSFWITKSVA